MDKRVKKTNIGYKLFEMDKYGKLFPLFIGKQKETNINEWVSAEYIPTKNFAPRGGWHVGADVPDAPWLKGYDGTDVGVYKSRFKKGKRVWCEVEYNASIDYNEEVELLPKKCFTDKTPEDGFYFFKEAGKGTWIITSDIKVIKIITEKERQDIMKSKGYDEVEAYKKYKDSFEKRMKISAG